MKTVTLFLIAIHLDVSLAAKPIELYCNYSKYATREGIKGDKFELTFFIEPGSKKAYMKGNNGMTDLLVVREDDEGYAFIQVTPTGNVMTTAIDKQLSSVHSRNSIISSKLIPSQYYGKCTKK